MTSYVRSKLTQPLRAQNSGLTAAAGQKHDGSVYPRPHADVPVTEGEALSRQWHSSEPWGWAAPQTGGLHCWESHTNT